jgi:hypothetical protein
MFNILRKRLLSIFRRLLGTEQILQQQQKILLMSENALNYSLLDPEKLKSTITYKRCSEIISLLSPMDLKGEKYVRVGGSYDGGYVLVDNFQMGKVDAAYSFGIGNDVSWDEDIANLGIDVFMFDRSINRFPKNNLKFHCFKKNVTGYEKGANLQTLHELIVENGHALCKNLIMKMDIEGCEWDVFEETASEIIDQFSQLVVEFHGLPAAVYDKSYLSVVNVLKKIKQTHQSIHVHANGAGIPLRIGSLVLPEMLEVTYIRRIDVIDKLIANTRQFPTELDQPTIKGWPDLYLGTFSGE